MVASVEGSTWKFL